ncbi:restriction endonuclease subunit S [Archaeoglobales archaeon]|nr:MAG: restriction endonuclease subunit S [Archaeoglobales archaeon]
MPSHVSILRQTPIGKIPEDWEVIRLGDVCKKIVDGTHKTPEYVKKGIPFISTQNLAPFKDHFDFSQYCKYISPGEHYELTKRCKPEKGDLLVSKCGTIGRTQLVRVDYEFSIFVGLALLKLKRDKVVPEYLEQLLNFEPMVRHMEILSPGATRKTLTLKAISKLEIPLPPLPEQRKIAEILSTVDKAIQKVDEAIAKTERLKKGLMQELLTKGIGHTEFKDTEIGRIPKEWEVVKLSKIAKLESGGTPSRQRPEFWENGTIPWVKSGELNDKVIYDTEERITESGLKNSSAKVFPKGTLLMALYGRGTVSKTAILGIDAATNQAVCAIIPKNIEFLPKFMQQYLIYRRETILNQLVNPSSDVGRTNIYVSSLSLLKVPLPPLSEQQKIAEILSTVDKKLELERKRKEKLERIKKGLMNDLLTGRRRVKV